MVRATFRAMKNCWPVGPANDVVGGPVPARWAGLGERLARWAGNWFAVRGGRPLGVTNGSRGEVCRMSGRTGGCAVRDFLARTGRRPAQRASHSLSQGRRPWWLPNHVPSGPTGRPFHENCGLRVSAIPHHS